MISIMIQAKIEPKEAILRLLTEKNKDCMNIQEISDKLDLSRPTVSKHCFALRCEKKIGGQKSGRDQIYYSLEK